MGFKKALKRYATKKIKIPNDSDIRCIALGLQGQDREFTNDQSLDLLLDKSLGSKNWAVLLKIQYVIHRCIPLMSQRLNKRLSEEQMLSIYGESETATIHIGLIDGYNLLIKASSAYYSLGDSAVHKKNIEEAVNDYTINKLITEAKSLILILSNLHKCAERCIYAHDMKQLKFTAFLIEYILEDLKNMYNFTKTICNKLADQFHEIDYEMGNYVSKVFEEFLELTESIKSIYLAGFNVTKHDIQLPTFENKVESLKKDMWNHEAEAECQKCPEPIDINFNGKPSLEKAKYANLVDLPVFPVKKLRKDGDNKQRSVSPGQRKPNYKSRDPLDVDLIQTSIVPKKKRVRFYTQPSSPSPYPDLDTDSVRWDLD